MSEKDSEFYMNASFKGSRPKPVPHNPVEPKPMDEGSKPPKHPKKNSALDEAIKKGEKYPETGKIFIVRGEQIFEVSSQDIKFDYKGEGIRDITIKNATMVKSRW